MRESEASEAVMCLRIDADLCVGHGRCYSLAPALFDCDDQGRGVVLVDRVTRDQRAGALLGVENCPERAITLTEG